MKPSKMNHPRRLIGLVALLAAAAVPVVGCGGSSSATGPIQLGEVMNLTGPSGVYGIGVNQGIQLAVARVNAAGGVFGRKLSVKVEDEASDNAQTVNVTRDMAANQKFAALIGPIYTPNLVAGQPIAASNKVVWFSGGTGTPIDAKGNISLSGHQPNPSPWTFQLMMAYNTLVLDFLKKVLPGIGAKKIATIYLTDNATQVFANNLTKKAAADLHLPLVADLGAASGTRDYGSQITKLLALRPDVVVVNMTEAEGATFMKQARARGLTSRWVAPGNSLNTTRLYGESGGAAKGLIIPADYNASSPAVGAFLKQFRQKFHGPPNALVQSLYGYDDIYLLVAAMKKAGRHFTRSSLRDALKSLGTFDAPLHGAAQYDGSGDYLLTKVYADQLSSHGFAPLSV